MSYFSVLKCYRQLVVEGPTNNAFSLFLISMKDTTLIKLSCWIFRSLLAKGSHILGITVLKDSTAIYSLFYNKVRNNFELT